ncbi:precorrin-2 dehydrogenase/sirohydrochlorin ferrochelatase family protein [Deinococcus terrestris]|uniref:precorrin-2 dehydrogenase/sirohydrochlorin ferrochelatase family protein n=1 Tax=Deinococcus terrestris TaxID=2651870 RepID=UPI002AD31657|nr:NAD(P)-dependent oxidoreductase [Deinococcus terrestris]
MTLAAFLNLSGEAAVVVGGGPVALRRARTLLGAGLRVRVVAPELHPDLAVLPVGHDPRPYRPGDVAGARVAVAATDSPEVNAAVAAEARAVGALVNHAGDAAQGTLRFPAVTRRGGVEVALTTGRELPLLAQALAERIAGLLPAPEQVDAWAERREAALTLPGTEREAALAALRADIRAAVGLLPAGVGA